MLQREGCETQRHNSDAEHIQVLRMRAMDLSIEFGLCIEVVALVHVLPYGKSYVFSTLQ